MPDKYNFEARYIPALVSSVPFLFFWFYYLKDLDTSFWQSASAVAIGSLGLSTALFMIAVHICRAIGKLVEEALFKQGLYFPTTEFLLDGDTNMSAERKHQVIAKINQKFGIDLTGKTDGSNASRRAVHEAVGQIRSMFYKKNEMVLQRNIQFGVAKNLFGGSVLATIASAIAALISSGAALHISVALLVVYVLLGLVSFLMIKFTAKHYAHTLYDEFLAS